MNRFVEMILSRCSVREFTGESVKKCDLEEMLKAGMSAPSAVNIQPWAFVVITDKSKMQNICRQLPYAKMLVNAGAAIVVCGLPGKDAQFAPKFWPLDCSAATENILLAAHALGYGAVWTAVYPEADRIEAVRRECHLPQDVIPLNVIPIGVPSQRSAKPIDKFKPDNIHWDNW